MNYSSALMFACSAFLLLDGVLRNFDFRKVPLCLFVRGKLG